MFSQRPNSGTRRPSGCRMRGAVRLRPRCARRALSAFGELRDRGVYRIEQQLVPRRELRIEQVHRRSADERPHRAFACASSASSRTMDPAPRAGAVTNVSTRRTTCGAERAHEAIGHRIRRRAAGPRGVDESRNSAATARSAGDGAGSVERRQQQRPPALEEQRAVVELHARASAAAWHCRSVIRRSRMMRARMPSA